MTGRDEKLTGVGKAKARVGCILMTRVPNIVNTIWGETDRERWEMRRSGGDGSFRTGRRGRFEVGSGDAKPRGSLGVVMPENGRTASGVFRKS